MPAPISLQKSRRASDSLCPLAHAGYTKVSGPSAGFQNFGIDPLAIIADTQTKLILIVADLHFDVAGCSVCESIPDHLAGDPVDLILKHRRQVPLLPFNEHLIARSMPVQLLSHRQFTACGIQQFRKVALRGRLRAQVANRSTALRNAFLRSMNCLIDNLHRVVRIAEQQFASRLELKSRPLKTLQQGVMQFSRNAHAFVHLSIDPDIELFCDLAARDSDKQTRLPEAPPIHMPFGTTMCSTREAGR